MTTTETALRQVEAPAFLPTWQQALHSNTPTHEQLRTGSRR
jgi:hypothetical protein